MRRRRVSRWSAAGIAAALSGALILTGLPAVADEAPTPEPTTPITVHNTVPDADAAVPDETPVADVAPEDEASVPAPEDAGGDAADDLARRDGGEATENLTDTLDNAVSPLAAAGTAPVCQAGYVYSVSGTGVVRQVNATTSPTSVTQFDGNAWDAVSASSSINGMAISANGAYMYAYERSGNGAVDAARILRYTAATGVWEQLPTSTGIETGNNNSLVTGAVNLSNGRYLFGGFHAQERGNGHEYQFRIYEFDPATNLSTYKGYIWTGQAATYERVNNQWGWQPAANGDMAFDAAGNLYIVRSGTTTRIYSVTAANLAAASGGSLIPANPGVEVTSGILSNVNGIAFDATGYVYLGNGTTVRKYDPTTWQQVGGDVTTGLSSSTDLASCNSPASLVVKKNVVGRVADSDQFTLAVRSGATTSATATTSGSATGIQTEQVGPVAVIAGNTYTVAETVSGTTDFTKYATTYVCTVRPSTTPIASGTTTSGTVQIPVSSGAGAAVECVFTNTPLTASVTITKQVQDSRGQNQVVAQGWAVNATASATSGSVTGSPSGTQATNSAGQAIWGLQFGTVASRATVTVSETQKPGFQFVSATCMITKLDGTTTTSTPLGEGGFALTGVAPGDKVACTYVNKVRPATVTIGKQLQDFTGANAQPAGGWTVGATLVSPESGVTITTPATAQTQPGTGQVSTLWTVDYPVPAAGQSLASATVNVQETMQTGYAFVSGTCTITSASGTSRLQELASATAQIAGLAPGENAVCTFTNKPIPGTVTWEKVTDGASPTHLAGSEWKIVGPAPASTELPIVDCVANSDTECSGHDKDHRAGYFSVGGLAWGSYTLVETKAPAGYLIDATERPIVISATALQVSVGAIVNEQQDVPSLPLTGGIGRDGFLIGGGIALLLAGGLFLWRRRRSLAST